MATIGNNARKRESQEATAKELVEEVYREWQIRGGNPRNREMTNPTEKPRQYCLVDKAMKEARIATIVGQRIIDGTSAPFFDEKKKGGQYRRAIRRILQLLRKERSQREQMLDQTP